MIFFKTSSFGNDFLVVKESDCPLGKQTKENLSRLLCQRHNGIGADGVVFFSPSREGIRFEIFNRDGSRAELSGNGMAGLAAVLFWENQARDSVLLLSKVGSHRVTALKQKKNSFRLRIEIGNPDFEASHFFPFLQPGQNKYAYTGIEFSPVSMGNPHAVVLVTKKLDLAEALAIGAKMESAVIFPARTNVEVVFFQNPSQCQALFYERGVGHTQASSTGCAAVFAVLRNLRLVTDSLIVSTLENRIRISGGESIQVETLTRIICRGECLGK